MGAEHRRWVVVAAAVLGCSPGSSASSVRPTVSVSPVARSSAADAPIAPCTLFSGELQWTLSFPSGTGDQALTALDPGGEVRWFFFGDEMDLGGGFIELDRFGGILARFSSKGVHRFSRGVVLDGAANAMALASNGDLWLTGFGQSSPGLRGGFLAQVTPLGDVTWRHASMGIALPRSLGVDSTGRVVVAGEFHGPLSWGGPTHQGAYGVATLPPQGQPTSLFVASFLERRLDWSRAWDHVAADVLVQPDGRIVLAGYIGSRGKPDFGGGPLPANAGFVAMLDHGGKHLASRGSQAIVALLATDRAGATMTAGHAHGDFGMAENDTFVARLDRRGEVAWHRALPRGWTPSQLGVDYDGNIVIAGDFRTELVLGELKVRAGPGFAVAKLDPRGKPLWLRSVLGARLPRISIGPTGQVLVTGWSEEPVRLDDHLIDRHGQYVFLALFGA